MRLITRLSLSHSVPVVLVAFALALLLAALVKMSLVLTSLNQSELGTLRDEGALHRAMWGLDVAMRHAHDGCGRGLSDAEASRRIASKAGQLAAALRRAPAGATMVPLAEQYLGLAHDMETGPTCAVLIAGGKRAQRELLDEQLTDLWVGRLKVLHDAVTAREEEARGIGVTAAWMGLSLTLASIVLALLVARRLARSLSGHLVSLAEIARRVGVGDFQTKVVASGPAEIRQLGDELEHMRQRLAQIDSLKQGFLASVSHELRTPLSKIREALALLQDGVVGPMAERQVRVVAIARQACEREIRMVSTLLDLSRLRSGSPLRPKEGTSIDAIVESAIRDEQGESEQKDVHIEAHSEGDAPPARLDPVLLERAIANLIRNAVAVSPKGGRVLIQRTVEEPTNDSPSRRLKVTVSDDGPGVPQTIRTIMFDAFVTHSVPQSGKALGIGLGLALSREIARAHGGDLELDESVPSGATFHLWVPVPALADGATNSFAVSCPPEVDDAA